MNDPASFREIERIFNEVCDLPSEARQARLRELLPDNETLRSEVLELLRADERAASGQGITPTRIRGEFDAALTAHPADPDEIGGYRIVGRLGQGGMGVVYEAEQQSPRRRVALKVLRPGLYSTDLIRRFQFEAEALGRLRHPSIAQIYEAGVTSGGDGPRPFFAMELVQGTGLTAWLRTRSVKERLAMIADICDAVQHAHARGVMHRDLKPANIMVTEEGLPKVLDFGVARALDADSTQQTLHTQAGQLVGTLPYMSPEQVSTDPREADTRSDVYTLGVILFEALTGSTPHDTQGLGLLEAADVIRDKEAARLSKIDARLRGDIEIITAKALQKDRDRRYQTAAELGDDIRRYLGGQTITARPASAVYQISRVAKRNLPVTIASGVALVALVGGVIIVSLALRDSIAQRAEAERRASIAEAVTSFFNNDVLAAVEPNALGHEVTVREAIDLAAATLPDRFQDQPVTGAAIRNNIANVYRVLGQFEAAATLAAEARDLFLAELGEEHELTRFAQQDVGAIRSDLGDFENARDALRVALDMRDRTVGPQAPETLENLVMLAELERDGFNDYTSAQSWLDEFDRRSAGVLESDDRIAVYADMTRGGMALAARDYETAAAAYDRVARAREEIYGETHSSTLTAWANLAVAYEAMQQYDDAEAIYLRVLEVEERMGGKDNPDRLPSAHNLAFLYQSTKRYEEAEALFIDTLERCRRVFGPVHPGTLTCVQSLTSLYRDTDRLEKAAEMLEAAYRDAVAELGETAPPVLEMASKLGVMYTELDRAYEGEALFAVAIPAVRELVPPGHPYLGTMLSQWGVCLHRLDRVDEAIAALTEAHTILSAAPGEEQAADARVAARRLAAVFAGRGDETSAATWSALGEEPAASPSEN